MSVVKFVQYDESVHKVDYIEMFVEYGKWLDKHILDHYGVPLFQNDIRETTLGYIPHITPIKPPEGINLVLMVDGKNAGMARFDKFDEGIGMIHNVFIYSEFRGKSYSKQMMDVIEEKARDYGYKLLRLDTSGRNVVSQNLYKKRGYVEIERFTDFENLKNEVTRPYYLEKVYMEKQL